MCNIDLRLFSHIELLLASPFGIAWTGRYGCGLWIAPSFSAIAATLSFP
jgi:hypothetical protein